MQTIYVTSEEAKTCYEAAAPWNEYDIVVVNTGIEDTEMGKDAADVEGYYDLNGRRITGKKRSRHHALLRWQHT